MDWLIFFGGLAVGWVIRAVLEWLAWNRPVRLGKP
jgi:hypothetical protein